MTYRSQARKLETKKSYPNLVSKMKLEHGAGSKIIFALSQNPPQKPKKNILAAEPGHGLEPEPEAVGPAASPRPTHPAQSLGQPGGKTIPFS